MNGFSKHLTADFVVYNAQALIRIFNAERRDIYMTTYTYSLPDINPLYCWAREESVLTALMSPEELNDVISLEEAVSQGMIYGE